MGSFWFWNAQIMHSTPSTMNTVLLPELYSLWKLEITPVPVGQPQFLFLCISCLSLIPSFLSAFTSHLSLRFSLWPSCRLSFALLHFIFLYLSVLYQSLHVHLLHSHLYLCLSVYQLLTVSFFQLFFSFSFSICNFSLANTSVNHMTVTLLS